MAERDGDGTGEVDAVTETLRLAWVRDCAFASETVLSEGSIVPRFVVHPREGVPFSVRAIWRDDEEKHATLHIVGCLAVASDAVGVSWIGEAWIVIDPAPSEMRASQSTRRVECVIVSMEGRNHRADKFNFMQALEIKRDNKSVVIGTEMIDLPTGIGFSGAFSDLVPTVRPTESEMLAASAFLAQGGISVPSSDYDATTHEGNSTRH